MNDLAPMSSGREVPHNPEAEQGLLGAILLNNRAFEKVSEFLSPDHFADAVHGRIYDECAKLIHKGQIANPVTLKALFDRDEALQDGGGARYLVRLAASVVTVFNAEDYGRQIFDTWQRRQLIAIAQELQADACRPDHAESGEIISRAQNDLDQLQGINRDSGDLEHVSDGLNDALEQSERARKGEALPGITTGITDLDTLLGPLEPGWLVVCAGRPGMGKTALALAVASRMASKEDGEGVPVNVGMFSQEMRAMELQRRLIAAATGISERRQKTGDLDENDMSRMVAATNNIRKLRLHIDETAMRTVRQIRSRVLRLKRRVGKLQAVIIDHLHIMAPDDPKASQNRVQEITQMTGGLKALAKEADTTIILLAQLNRSVESRDDKRPTLADLRESGSIEQDTDIVMFLFREEYYLAKSEPQQRLDESDEKFMTRHDQWSEKRRKATHVLEVTVAKYRAGPTGSVRLFADMSTGKITNASHHNRETF